MFPLPIDRNDINTALTRHSMLSGKGARVDAGKLMPNYGQQRKSAIEVATLVRAVMAANKKD